MITVVLGTPDMLPTCHDKGLLRAKSTQYANVIVMWDPEGLLHAASPGYSRTISHLHVLPLLKQAASEAVQVVLTQSKQ